MRAYRQNRDVLHAEPNYIYHALTTPNDPKFSRLWGLQNTGQNLGTVGADIHASQAWSLTTGSSSVVVAVIESCCEIAVTARPLKYSPAFWMGF